MTVSGFDMRPDAVCPRAPNKIQPARRVELQSRARPQDMTKANKVRLRFAKCGDLRLVSHHDLMRCLERMLRRAQIPVAMSQGLTRGPR